MKKIQQFAVAFLALGMVATAQTAQQPVPSIQPPTADTNAAPANLAPPDYRLGAGDMIAITAYGTPEFDRTATVGSDGNLAVSYLKVPISASGKTVAAVGISVASEMEAENLVVDPQIEASLVAAQSHVVTVGGAVKSPAVLYLTRSITLLDAIVRAGGVDLTMAGATVTVTSGSVTREIPYDQVAAGNPFDNPILSGGEHVEVSAGGEVFVAGAVNQPGGFPITANTPLTASRAIALAKGWELVGSKADQAVIVRTLPGGGTQDIPINLPKVMDLKATDIQLQANDVLYVPQNKKARVGMAALTASVSSVAYAFAILITR